MREKMQRIIETYEEFRQATSIDELIALYAQRGYQFEPNIDFLNQVSFDWTPVIDEEVSNARKKPIPKELPCEEIVADGVTHSIHGITHIHQGQEYLDLVRQALDTKPNWISEANLGFSMPTKGRVIVLPDHAIISSKELFKHNLTQLTKIPWLIWRILQISIKNPTYVQEHLRDLNIPPDVMQSQCYKVTVEEKGQTFKGNLPFFVSLGYTTMKFGSIRNLTDAMRSGYMAEFMRAYKPGEDKSILVGATHVAEIAYFLRNGFPHEELRNVAKAHAEICTESPENL